MLEEKITDFGKKAVLVLFAIGATYCSSANQSAKINTKELGKKVSITTTCCSELNCVKKGYDYCAEDGIKTLGGTSYIACSCHDDNSLDWNAKCPKSYEKSYDRDWRDKFHKEKEKEYRYREPPCPHC